MKENNTKIVRTCPKCGRTYTEYPAISRDDEETKICPDCGIREALESIGVPADEQEHIIEDIHKYEQSE